jgi:hypothetical protein
VKAGDKFRYGGQTYRATANATGEFNAYIRCYNDATGSDTEIIVPHGNIVTMLSVVPEDVREVTIKWDNDTVTKTTVKPPELVPYLANLPMERIKHIEVAERE